MIGLTVNPMKVTVGDYSAQTVFQTTSKIGRVKNVLQSVTKWIQAVMLGEQPRKP